jgi:arsenite methyltransferase
MSMTPASSDYFDKVAGDWDQIRSGFFTEAVRQAAIAKAYLRPEMVVADVGSGTGFMAAGLAPLVRRVYALDGSPAMLDVARKNLAQFNNIVYQEADGQSLPLPDESLDAVFANMYLHHCPDPLAAIREMVRVLRPGGRLVITDEDSHNYEWLKDEMADVWLGFERSQLRAWFQQAGLVNTIVDCTGQSCCAESQNPQLADAQGRTVSISIFVATGTRRVGGVEEAVRQGYGKRAQDQGSGCCSPQETVSSSSCCSPAEKAPAASRSCGVDPAVTTAQSLDAGYETEELQSAPAEAAEFSLGCGNPTAIAGLKAGEVVLDIGSGGGLDSFLSAQKVGSPGRVIGVDMTPEMLERARQTAEKSGYSNVEFRFGHAEDLPVKDSTVDVVLSNCVINLTSDKGKAFNEAFRVLKEGGRLHVSDIVTDGQIPLDMREDPNNWPDCVYGALPEQEYLDLISQAGFTDMTVRRSPSLGEGYGIKAYSITVSASKAKVASSCC